jgi:CDGSH-type Zn-finger protein
MTARAVVTLYAGGPLVVRGDVELVGALLPDGWRDRPAIALCRCGRSAQAPLCDGSHKLVRFDGPGRSSPR